ncbi:hypothetical protein [Leeuwenhoekiella marinoflava]|uniref:Uncharacterized protein n=2 Tax=Leeuwenhoekiella marinoflava TaxID=988 RepID=A0A4Q0PK77_9FLAO|nr:hypothetical protein [Leeuwenhoekiella marinoflava]RXG26856.1 hypothetical protein DSL99_3166 [Leeuwenhoekiella marinoflava]SHF39436.1 hypothetical protein SAMN02745246_02369 [Leeuwenhoekiella marinoflava DSM 3653]
METPIELELVGKKDDLYAINYPGLKVPIHVNFELLQKFKKSSDYVIRESESFKKIKNDQWFLSENTEAVRI